MHSDRDPDHATHRASPATWVYSVETVRARASSPFAPVDPLTVAEVTPRIFSRYRRAISTVQTGF